VNANGLFFAGDTAQTISVGSAFRFNDLKAFLYRVEVCLNHLESTGLSHTPARSAVKVKLPHRCLSCNRDPFSSLLITAHMEELSSVPQYVNFSSWPRAFT
jgi:hypothetical protein